MRIDDPQVTRALAAVEDARSGGLVRSLDRTGEHGGRELVGAPFRYVLLDEPPCVHFPDARSHSSAASALMTTSFVVAFAALVFAVVSAATGDWPFFAGFAVVAIACGVAGWRLDRIAAARDSDLSTGHAGLTLLPDRLVLIDRRGTTVVDRADVVEFGVRRSSPVSSSRVKFTEFVRFGTRGSDRVDLQPWADSDQRAACESWRAGAWPPELPT